MLRKLFGIGKDNQEAHLKDLGLEFESMEQAQSHFNDYRTKKLKQLEELAETSEIFTPTYEAKSLIGLETLYHDIYLAKNTKEVIPQSEFKELINYYNAAVFIHYGLGEWQVQEGLFSENKYVDGILYGYGSWSNLSYAEKIDKGNKKRDSLFKEFMMYIPEEEEHKYL